MQVCRFNLCDAHTSCGLPSFPFLLYGELLFLTMKYLTNSELSDALTLQNFTTLTEAASLLHCKECMHCMLLAMLAVSALNCEHSSEFRLWTLPSHELHEAHTAGHLLYIYIHKKSLNTYIPHLNITHILLKIVSYTLEGGGLKSFTRRRLGLNNDQKM